MHRFFVPPAILTHQPVTLTGDQAHQVRRVLRMRLGDHAVLLDGQGWAHEGILIAVGEDEVRFQTTRRWEAGGEPATHITLYQAVLKGERFGWALQKGAEVGVSAFVPLICERNVVDDMAAVESKRERWERIIQEAAEQSGRGRLPQLLPARLFAQAIQPTPLPASEEGNLLPLLDGKGEPFGSRFRARAGGEVRLIPWENERGVSLRQALSARNFTAGTRIQVFVGPEGGFTGEEVHLARSYGIQPVTLGPRILRAETAGVIAAALILYEAGEL